MNNETEKQLGTILDALEDMITSARKILDTPSPVYYPEPVGGPDCYKCRHRGTVPGSCHSSCKKYNAKVRMNDHGVKMGWAVWPLNFDPVWVDACNGFEPLIPEVVKLTGALGEDTPDNVTTCHNECFKCGAPIDVDVALCTDCDPSGLGMSDDGDGERPNRPSGTWEAER